MCPRMVHDTDIVELELKSKRFSLAVRKKEALEAAEPTVIYQVSQITRALSALSCIGHRRRGAARLALCEILMGLQDTTETFKDTSAVQTSLYFNCRSIH